PGRTSPPPPAHVRRARPTAQKPPASGRARPCGPLPPAGGAVDTPHPKEVVGDSARLGEPGDQGRSGVGVDESLRRKRRNVAVGCVCGVTKNLLEMWVGGERAVSRVRV